MLISRMIISGQLQNVRFGHFGRIPLYRHRDQQAFDFKGPGGYQIYPHKFFYKFLFRRRKGGGPLFSKIPVGAPSISLQVATELATPTRIETTKRVKVLDKLFARYIPEVLYTSEFGDKLADHNVEFSKVKISPDYTVIRVYWIPKIDADNNAIQEILNEVAKPLRREMCNLHVTGIVPPIRFIKDNHYAVMVEIDRRLKIADFGENFKPTIVTDDILKGELQLHTHLPIQIRERIAMLEREKEETEEDEAEPLIIPLMEQNVFCLHRDIIMNRINQGKKRAHFKKLIDESEESLLGSSSIKPIPTHYEVESIKNWNRRIFFDYMKKHAAKKKLREKESANLQQLRAIEEAYEVADQPEDELYAEFVENAFEDCFEDKEEAICDQHEL